MKKSDTIKISVSGRLASGKTTVAELITWALAKDGFEVKLSDEQLIPFDKLGERREALRDKVPKIEVRTASVMEEDRVDAPARMDAVHTFVRTSAFDGGVQP
jgi:uridine kinase